MVVLVGLGLLLMLGMLVSNQGRFVATQVQPRQMEQGGRRFDIISLVCDSDLIIRDPL
jgi:hypothetical protein